MLNTPEQDSSALMILVKGVTGVLATGSSIYATFMSNANAFVTLLCGAVGCAVGLTTLWSLYRRDRREQERHQLLLTVSKTSKQPTPED
jgi:hypothetical protein